ncbi:DUF2574 family protein [Salmonella enterica subsp. enterica serovar Saintpaul]|nr:DUF2574 family protein [Salmonella enterica subsp. enterica serovar Saintpaul]
MKKSLFLGVITLAYGMSLQAFASDIVDGKLTIVGHVVVTTCHRDMSTEDPRNGCQGNAARLTSGSENSNNLGVSTQHVMLPGDTKRQIVLNTYD